MVRIPFYFCGTAFVTAREQWRRNSTQRRSGREKQSFARHLLFRLLHVRNNFFRGLKRAAAEAGKRKRCTHQFQECAAFKRIVPFFCLLRKLTRDEFTKLWRVGEFIKRTPIFFGFPAARS